MKMLSQDIVSGLTGDIERILMPYSENTLQMLLELISQIYQSPRIEEMLELIHGTLKGSMDLGPIAAFIPFDSNSSRYQSEGHAVIPQSSKWVEDWLIFYSKLDPFISKIPANFKHKALRYSDVISEKDFLETKFYQEFLSPLSIRWSLLLPLVCFEKNLGFIWISRDESGEEFSEVDLEIGTMIAYHASIALQVQSWRNCPPLDVSPGILVLDGLGQTIYQNEESERILRKNSVNWFAENANHSSSPRIIHTDHGDFRARIFCLRKPSDPVTVSLIPEPRGKVVVLEPYPPKLALCRKMKELELSKRQSEIILEIMRGRTNKEIAIKLGVTLQTVKDHLYTIFQQLKVRNRSELIMRVMGDLSFSEEYGGF